LHRDHLVQIRETLGDARLQSAIRKATGRKVDRRRESISQASPEDFDLWREQARCVKQHTLENLDHYIERMEANLGAHGGQLVYARDGGEAAEFLVRLAKQKRARLLVKSKSMTAEEIGLRERLEDEALEVAETDLGEFLVQMARQRPYHITAPALHMTRHDVADLLSAKRGVEREVEPEKQTMIARRALRQRFLTADIGVTGANFLVAESGAVVIVENEGNVRLTSSCPRIQVVVAGVEKLIPRSSDLVTFLKLLGRSANGQALTAYTSVLAGPRRPEEVDGPDEFYLVLVDNGRTRILADRSKRESLSCIRCGACLNHCPVYRTIGGHSYPRVYSGPIGAIITPQFHGTAEAPWLPFASSLCGACSEVCPVRIDIPRILLELRAEIVKARLREDSGRLERLGFRLWARVMRHPRLFEAAAMFRALILGGTGAGPVKEWIGQRDLPRAPAKTFRQMWRETPGKRK